MMKILRTFIVVWTDCERSFDTCERSFDTFDDACTFSRQINDTNMKLINTDMTTLKIYQKTEYGGEQ